ncbi:hypothetical protein [Mucilaginibacter glaciei]|uniref:Uncharacterized protein n=1 Tax=Mucilaginibacter glaciei TaxID=2772109 RepID=A0A926NX69_9SPHI|nr:hypothetical protein [Mucilaginibacter glaciei]MBD1393349.1 hypothetical protein [Mucilaginibacter glaciei]
MKTSIKTIVMLKAIDLELKRIIDADLQKFKAGQQRKKNLAFVQMLMAA